MSALLSLFDSVQRHHRLCTSCFPAAVLSVALLCSQPACGGFVTNETPQQRDGRMAWWRHARFGMFIHWGVYAVPGGQWNDDTDHAEWIQHTAQIPVEYYEKLSKQFNPVNFDADQWVKMARDAGMKYLVITSKHHDGFCLWPSDVGNYNVLERTPFKRDILGELAEACKKYDVRLCFYYSIMDWHHPDYLPRRNWEDRSTQGADFSRYIRYMKAQLKELIQRYDPAVLWFDGEWENTWTHEMGQDLYDYVRSLKPDIIINNRVDKGRTGMAGLHDPSRYAGDFGTPEQEVPATGLSGYDWESCITMNRHWGWNKHDKDFKSTESLIQMLVDIVSKGGNLLLNVGPKPDGTFPQESVERLAQIGQWMRLNGEAIYGTTAGPFEQLTWGRCTTKHHDDGTTLYIHVFDWPEDGVLLLPGLRNRVKKVHLLATEKSLQAESVRDGVQIQVPDTAADPYVSVIKLEIVGEPLVEKVLPRQAIDGTLKLPAVKAEIYNPTDSNTRVEIKNTIPNIGFWTDPKSWVKWRFNIDKPGSFAIHAATANPASDSQAEIRINDIVRPVSFPPTGDYATFHETRLAIITLDRPGEYSLHIRPNPAAWNPINVRSITLKPVPKAAAWAVEQRDQRMQWWRQARFGMFIHWGLYSGLAGTWDDKPVGTRGGMEWIQNHVRADTKTYAECAIPLFKPSPDFANEWAKLARVAGCRYMVVTTKHHDGFALHDSKVGDYNAGAVLGRDLVREIVNAARDAGLRIGFYHSVIDWHHPDYDYTLSNQLPHPIRATPPEQPRNHNKYLDYLHAQVDELISNYGPIDVMWWDYSAQDFQGQTAWRAFDLMDAVRIKQPHIIMNNRLFRIPQAGWVSMSTAGYTMRVDPIYADFITPEQHIPATGAPGVDWETCMTMNTTWGYSEHDHAWKSAETLIRNLVDIVSKGGNYLLNIGPKADGSIPVESIERMHTIGRWMHVNSESIFATTASPFAALEWGRCTQKPDGNDTLLYLHIFDWPEDGVLLLPGLRNRVKKVHLLATEKSLQAESVRDGVQIQVPDTATDPYVSVIKLEIVGKPLVE